MNLGNFRFRLCFIKSYSSMLYRSLSSIKPQHNVSIEHLKQRCLLRLSGPDTANYLQGMVTNDMISNNNVDQPCMYALLLNFHGRILYDTLLYKVAENEYLMEYDASAVQYMKRHLEMYRLRKHVIVRPVTEMSVWVAYPHENTDSNFNSSATNEFISSLKSTDFVVAAVKDPRIPDLGFRIITQNNNKVEQLLENFVTKSPENTPYNLFRYKLGVGEGVLDHPPGNSFPFETNVDFLNGVSFQKGCYIGQELTARVHHTGVVRKRIMPIVLQLESESYPNLPVSCTVVNDKGAKVGKFRSNIGKYGLAVLNTEECLKAQTLMLNRLNIKLTTFRPNWWPQDIYSIKH